jgi:hypothetical protein
MTKVSFTDGRTDRQRERVNMYFKAPDISGALTKETPHTLSFTTIIELKKFI